MDLRDSRPSISDSVENKMRNKKADGKPAFIQDCWLRNRLWFQFLTETSILIHGRHICHLFSCYVMLCYVMLCYVMLCYVMLCYVMLCYVMLCYVMLCYVMLCYVMLCYVMLSCVLLCC